MSGLRRLQPAEYERLRAALAAERLPADDLCCAANRFYALEEDGHAARVGSGLMARLKPDSSVRHRGIRLQPDVPCRPTMNRSNA